MFCVFLPLDEEPIASLLPHDLDEDNAGHQVNIVQDPIIPEPQLPAGHWVGMEWLDPSGPLGGLVTEMNLQSVEHEPSGVHRQRS